MATPIVLIHGIKGSHLAQTYDDSFDTIWSGVQKGFESIWDLELSDDGEVEKDPRDLITVMRIESLAYGEILGRLRKKMPDSPIYIFRYDWRRDNLHNAHKLQEFLSYSTKKTGSERFRFITHSMGGLILSAFLNLKPTNVGCVERAAMTVPPFTGSPEAIRGLIVGEASLLGINSSEAFRKIGRTFPSVYQLVPGYQGAWEHHDPNADIWDIGYWQRRIEFGGRPRGIYDEKEKLMKQHLARARNFQHKDMVNFDAMDNEDKRKFLVFYGTGERTLQSVKVLDKNRSREVENFFDFEENGNYNSEGDGTVPVKSALRFSTLPAHPIDLSKQRKWWLPTTYDEVLNIQLAGFHGAFLALDKVQSVVIDWLEGKDVQPEWSAKITS